jgi:hypothetical protein
MVEAMMRDGALDRHQRVRAKAWLTAMQMPVSGVLANGCIWTCAVLADHENTKHLKKSCNLPFTMELSPGRLAGL